MRRLGIAVHALDRTGPPILARTFARWALDAVPGIEVVTVAFRGGPLRASFEALGPVVVLLHDHEPWDHASPVPSRAAEAAALIGALPSVDAWLLVSVAAGQCLRAIAEAGRAAPTVTWVVEQGEDLRWLDEPVGLEATARWLAGAPEVAAEVLARRPGLDVTVVGEFVAEPVPSVAFDRDRLAARAASGAPEGGLLVVGAGIATHRKAPDLFVEVAAAVARRRRDVWFRWIGGEDDPLFGPLHAEVDRVGLSDRVSFVPSVEDLDPWLAAADLLLHPARLDAFPLVCLHAALLGTPVVAFEGAGGVEEMFGADLVGAPYPDVAGLGAAVLELTEPAARRRVAQAQQDRARRHWTVAVGGPRLLGALEGVA